MTDLIWIVIGVVTALAIVWFFVCLKRRQDELERNFQERFHGRSLRLVDKYAVFRAQESDGYSQSEGMGYLALTDEELYFERTMLRKLLIIPVGSIREVGDTKRVGGQGHLKRMLKVDFEDEAGKRDSIALHVKDLPQWKREISAVMG
jgi:hypothetical protein